MGEDDGGMREGNYSGRMQGYVRNKSYFVLSRMMSLWEKNRADGGR